MKPVSPAEPPSILWSDADFIAVDKPSGAVVHRSSEHRDATVIMLQWLRDAVGRPVHPVHRLDRPTSGVLVFAFGPESTAAMQATLTGAEKHYIAMVRGETAIAGVIDRPLTQVDGDVVQSAHTEYRRLAIGDLGVPFGAASLLAVTITTGRRHQIRRHFAGLARHLLLDTRYGKGGVNRHCRSVLGLERLFLHASALRFDHPLTGAPVAIEAPLPPDLRAFLGKVGIEPGVWAARS